MSCPSDQVMGATGTLTCVPPSHVERLEVDSKSFTQHSSRICFLYCCCCCFVLFQGGKVGPGKDLRAGGSGKGSAILPFLALPALLGSSAPTLQGKLGYKDPRAKSFIGEKKTKEKAVPFCRTQGCPANSKFLLCVTEQSGKGKNAGHACPMGKKLLQTVSLQYVQITL